MTRSTFRLDVKESLLHWAMDRSNKSIGELSKKQNLRKLNEWLAGTRKPTRLQLEAFAKATYTPFGYLLLSDPPHEQPSSIPHFRTMKNSSPKRSINLEDIIRIIEQRQEWMRDYLIEIGAERLKFVGSSRVDDDPVDVANNIRMTLGLTPGWTATRKWETAQKLLQSRIEDARIFLSVSNMVQHNRYRQLDPKEFRGFVLVDDYAPFVFVNSADIRGAQMFTLAHELAHVWVGESASFDLHRLAPNPNIRLELACNKIAAEFLVSTKELLQHWDQFTKDPDGPYKAMSRHFKVSSIVAARRALDTRRISQKKFDEFYDRYARNALQKKKQELKARQDASWGPLPSTIAPPRISKRFMQTIVTAVRERKILYREAYSLTGLKSETFDEIKNKIEGGKH